MKTRICKLVFFSLIISVFFATISVGAATTKTTDVKNKAMTISGYKGSYTGKFVSNKANGKGVFTFNDSGFKVTANGTWKNNALVGEATITMYSDVMKIVEKGKFTNFYLNGNGTFTLYDNSNLLMGILKGNFINNNIVSGKASYYLNGVIIRSDEGSFVGNKINGNGKRTAYDMTGKNPFVVSGKFNKGELQVSLANTTILNDKLNYYYVLNLFGREGQPVTFAETTDPAIDLSNIKKYIWENADGSSVTITFEYDKVTSIEQNGLK